MMSLIAAAVIGSLATILAAAVIRMVVVPAYLLRLFGALTKTMRFDLATPQSMKTMVVLAVPPLEPWFSERAAGNMLVSLRDRFPPYPSADDRVSGDDLGPATYFPASPPPAGVTLPPEYAALDGLLLAWPWHYPSRWAPHASFIGAVLAAEARAVIATSEACEWRELDAYLKAQSLDTSRIDYIVGPVDDVWMRDYGPTFVTLADGGSAIVANPYVPGEHPYRKGDNAVSFTVGAALGLPVYRLPLLIEGGNMVPDGHGLMVMTTSVLDRNPELNRDDVTMIMHEYFGCSRCEFIESLPAEVTGHADMVVRFLDPHTVVVASAPPKHRWAKHFDRVAAQIERLPAHDGAALRVHRLSIAPGNGSAFWSYVNCTQVNGHTIVPVFGVSTDAAALQFYRDVTGGPVTGVDFSDFLVGSAHCQSKEVPHGALTGIKTWTRDEV